MTTRSIIAALAGAACLSPLALDAQTIAITGGRVYPVSGAPIEHGTVLIRNGKIVAVGADVAIPADARRIDATGKWVTPGFVNAGTELGISEIEGERSTVDVSAAGAHGVAAAFRAWEGVNPRSVLLGPARKAGVTSFVPLPAGNLVAGQAAVLDIYGAGIDSMLVKGPVAMVVNLGPGGNYGDTDESAATATGPAGVGRVASRGELLLRLREVLTDARDYARRRADFERGDTRQFIASRADLEAMIPVVEGRLPMLVNVDRASDIENALRIAREFNVRLIIGGGDEAWQVAPELAAAKVPVLAGAMNNIPSNFGSLGSRQENAALLRKAGVTVVLIGNAGGGDEQTFNVRNIRYEAGNGVAYGMTWDDALRAVTLAPAEVFGVGDRIGSLQAGREANVVVWSGDPFEFTTRAEHVLVRGVEDNTPTRQDLLMQRYRTLPPAYIPAP